MYQEGQGELSCGMACMCTTTGVHRSKAWGNCNCMSNNPSNATAQIDQQHAASLGHLVPPAAVTHSAEACITNREHANTKAPSYVAPCAQCPCSGSRSTAAQVRSSRRQQPMLHTRADSLRHSPKCHTHHTEPAVQLDRHNSSGAKRQRNCECDTCCVHSHTWPTCTRRVQPTTHTKGQSTPVHKRTLQQLAAQPLDHSQQRHGLLPQVVSEAPS